MQDPPGQQPAGQQLQNAKSLDGLRLKRGFDISLRP